MDYKCALFDGTFEGFLNIVYDYYYEKNFPDFIDVDGCYQTRLMTEYYYVYSDAEKSERVMNGLHKKASTRIFNIVYNAFYAEEFEDRFLDIFNFIILSFKIGAKAEEHLTTDFVRNTLKYYKRVSSELLRQIEFCRFAETRQGVFYCPISPRNDILKFVCGFFVDRFYSMNFVIHDTKRNIAGIYDQSECVIVDTPQNAEIVYSENERRYQEYWFEFYNSATNDLRINSDHQRAMLPKYFRKNMTEFNFPLDKYNMENKNLPKKI